MNGGRWRVDGLEQVPDGYNDRVSYAGNSWWQMLKAVRVARRGKMVYCVTWYGDKAR